MILRWIASMWLRLTFKKSGIEEPGSLCMKRSNVYSTMMMMMLPGQ